MLLCRNTFEVQSERVFDVFQLNLHRKYMDSGRRFKWNESNISVFLWSYSISFKSPFLRLSQWTSYAREIYVDMYFFFMFFTCVFFIYREFPNIPLSWVLFIIFTLEANKRILLLQPLVRSVLPDARNNTLL